MKLKRLTMILLSITLVYPVNLIWTNTSAAASASPNFTGIYRQGNYVKLEWATEMDPSDVLTSTSFESGEEVPNTVWGGTNINGNQSVATIAGAYTGSKVFQLTDNITNSEGNSVNPPSNYYSTYSQSTFKGKSIPSGSTISVSYKARALNSTTSKVYFSLSTGWYKRGYPLIDRNGKNVVFSERFDFNNPPLNLPIKNSDGTVPEFNNGHVAILVSSKSQNHEYGVLRYSYNSAEGKFVKYDGAVWGDTYPLGQRPTVIKDVFSAGDNVLIYSQGSSSSPNRDITSNNWTTINANLYIPDNPEYNTTVMGLAPRIYWTTNGTMQIDDLKFGYASEVEVYRDGNSIYRGYLSDYEDRAAIDRTAPVAPSNLNVSIGAGRKPIITWNPSADLGTTYNYQIKGYPKNSSPTALSANNPISVTSGIKGYSVVIDQNPNTIPPAVVTTTSTSYTGAAEITGNFYVHVAAIDNENNRSNVTHYKYTDTIKPTLDFIIANTSWTNKPVTIRATATDYETGIKRIQLPDKTWVNQNNVQYDVNQNGIYTFLAEDNAGNQLERSITIANIDSESPKITLTPEKQEWTEDEILVQINAFDSLSGLQPNGTYYKVTDSVAEPTDWELLTDSSQPVRISTDGQWYVHVKATDRAGNTEVTRSDVMQLQHKPESPKFQVTDVAHDKVTLTWDLPTNSYTDGYEYLLLNTVTGATYKVNYPVNQVTDGSVSGGREYNYILTVKNHVGEATSNLKVLTKPNAPTDIRVEKVGREYNSALLIIEPIEGATSHHIVVRNAFGDLFIDEITTNNQYLIQNLSPGTTYTVLVSAINAAGEGPNSSISYLSLPDTPGGFTAVQIKDTTIDLEWNSVTTATYYNLERDYLTIFDELDLKFKDTGLEKGTNYSYQVMAVNATGEGQYSDPLHLITLPGQIINFTLNKVTTNSAVISWPGVKGAAAYTLNLSDGQEITVTDSVYSVEFTNLSPGTNYEIQGYATNRSGQGDTLKLNFETLPIAPDASGIVISNIQENSAEISWDLVPGATKYRIIVDGQEYEMSTNHLSLTGLSGSKVFRFTIEAGNSAGYGAQAEAMFVTKPRAVSNLQIIAVNRDSVQIAWGLDETSIGYYVELVGSSNIQEVSGQNVKLTGLRPGTSYAIDIWTKNESGEGKKTTLRVTTKTVPVNPEEIIVSVEEEQVIIVFTPAENAKEHVLKDSNGEEVWRGAEGPIVIKPIDPGTNYEYTIVAENDEGLHSNETKINFITIPSSPEGITTGQVTQNEIEFDFTDTNLTGANEIIVYRDGEEISRIPIPLEENKYSDTQLKPNTSYEYEFKLSNNSGVSEGIKIVIKTKGIISVGNPEGSPGGSQFRPGPDQKQQEQNPVVNERTDGQDTIPNPGTSSKNIVFEDVSESSFAAEAIAYLTDHQIIKGVTDNIFEPNRPISRMEFAALIVRAIEAGPDNSLEITYKDINQKGWYMKELNAAISNNVAVGFSKTEFRPSHSINREQAAKMLGNVVIKKYGITSSSQAKKFNDIQSIASWAAEDISVLSALNVISGYPDGSFSPKGNITRAESAVLIYNMLKLKNN